MKLCPNAQVFRPALFRKYCPAKQKGRIGKLFSHWPMRFPASSLPAEPIISKEGWIPYAILSSSVFAYNSGTALGNA